MKHLTHQNWTDLFYSIATIHADITPETLGTRAISAVQNIISSELMAFDCFRENDFSVEWLTPEDAISPADVEIFLEFADEHPLIEATVIEKRAEATRVTDLITRRQFNSTGLFNEFYRRMRITDTMAVSLPISDDLTMTNSLYRSGRNFSDAECLMLTILAAHLRAAIINSKTFGRLKESETQLQSALESKHCGVVSLKADYTIAFLSEFAAAALEKYFGFKQANLKYLPGELKRWLKSQHSNLTTLGAVDPLEVFHKITSGDELFVRMMPNTQTSEVNLLVEEKVKFDMKKLELLRLTKRETEIVFWISWGKTNKDIAGLLGISPRTVNKHAENIFLKLGVETRTAAASVVLHNLKQN